MTHACLGFVVWPAHQEKGWWPRDSGTAKSAVRDAPAQRRPIGVRKRLQLPGATMHAGKVPETPRELPLAETVTTRNINCVIGGGEGGIRTHGTVTRTTVFETVPFDHSGTSPKAVRPPMVLKERHLLADPLPRGNLRRGDARAPSLIDLWSCTYILRRLVGSATKFCGLRPHRFLWAPTKAA